MTGRYSKERGKGKGKVNGVWLIAASLTTMGTSDRYNHTVNFCAVSIISG